MKILKEAKEDLPVQVLTNFIGKAWDEVGILKEQITAISSTFKGTKKIEELIQSLVDAYLVCIGQMEAHLEAKDYLEIPKDESEIKDKKGLSEDLALVDIQPVIKAEEAPVVKVCSTCVEPEIETETCPVCNRVKEPTQNTEEDPFEYFCDFGDPIEITDDDLYQD